MSAPMWEREGVSAPVAGYRDAARAGGGGVLFVDGEAGLRKSSAQAGEGVGTARSTGGPGPGRPGAPSPCTICREKG
jgi:hypothetical protein